MQLAISILNRNGFDDTIKCVDSVLESYFSGYKIFLLDNGSKNNEYEKLKEKYGKDNNNIILSKADINLGFTGGNNFNIDLILKEQFQYVLLLNNDCILDKDFLSKFMKGIEDCNKKGIFGPIIKSPNGTTQAIGSYINLWTGSSVRLKEIEGECQEVDYVTGSCMVIPIELIRKIGGLDDKFFAYREESDFCLRAKKEGYKSYSLNIDGVIHKEEAATKKVKPYYAYLMFRNRILFLKKHSNLVQYIFSYIVLGGYLFVIFPRNFGLKNYKYAIRGIIDGMKDIGGPFIA